MLTGIIVKGIGGFYYVTTDAGLIECRARGIFRKQGQQPLVGDKVLIKRTTEDPTKGSLEEILPRKNQFVRPPVANIDQLIITVAAGQPEPNLLLVDQLTVTAEMAHVKPVICINKMDLDAKMAEELASVYRQVGYETLLVSARQDSGTDALRRILQNKTTAFAGNSGVGKSTLLNCIGGSFGLETGSLSEKTQRGRHTTRHTELFPLPFGGYVFDTPGFSSYESVGLVPETLAEYFPDIHRHADACRFAGCAHMAEPDCSVKAALEDGQIAKERYESYCTLYTEAKKQKKW